MPGTDFDVLVMGGGLAGSLLARQLSRQCPDARVMVVEKRAETDFKVGESTVEIFADYLIRRLGLSTYLYEEHLPKNGLRFFFDDAERKTPLEEMSEIGSTGLPWIPSFQIDRRRFEDDLRERARVSGVTWVHGRVRGIELGADSHRVTIEQSGKTELRTTRWLVDASGRAGLLAKLEGWRLPCPNHAIAGAWGRFEGVLEWDDDRPEPFRSRVRQTSRRLSTNHFCYPGYWIWLIPLRGGVTSVGIVGLPESVPGAWNRPAGFRELLDRHRAVRDLLAPARMLDFGTYPHLAHGTRRFLDARRVALIGEAAAFTDPFYSPGSDFIALENDLTCDLVARDSRSGAVDRARVAAYEDLLQGRFALNLQIYESLYPLLGSFELFRHKWDLDLTAYYDLWLSAYLRDEHLDLERLAAAKQQRPFVQSAVSHFNRRLRLACEDALSNGTYFEGNRGRFLDALATIDFVKDIGGERTESEILRVLLASFRRVRRGLLPETDSAERGEPGLEEFVSGQALAVR